MRSNDQVPHSPTAYLAFASLGDAVWDHLQDSQIQLYGDIFRHLVTEEGKMRGH